MNNTLRNTSMLAILLLFLLAGCDSSAGDVPPSRPTVRVRSTPLPTVVAVATPDCNGRFFEETKRTVCQPFLAHWEEKGGLAIYGFPISDLIQETVKATGEVYTAQYFERARFELHNETGQQVMLGRLGALIQKPQPAVAPLPEAQFFPETGHNLKGPFLKFWTDHGGLAQFGFPITEERVEKSQSDQKDYTVQYFERTRFEYHPENAGTAFEVQIGQLGTQLFKRLYRR
jgi:hypothetical protein